VRSSGIGGALLFILQRYYIGNEKKELCHPLRNNMEIKGVIYVFFSRRGAESAEVTQRIISHRIIISHRKHRELLLQKYYV
jgi:adenosylmethionine-8-amino-7-oxononanoate aminotransferase